MVINTVGHLAEAAWHHPDITASYAWVEVRLQNHAAKGITDKDFELAKKIEDVVHWQPGQGRRRAGRNARQGPALRLHQVRRLKPNAARQARGYGETPMGDARIDGRPVALEAAIAEAARMLAASRLPVIAGLGTDIAGARAAVALADRIGGVVDHMHAEAVLRDLAVMRQAGAYLTTPNEARLRGDTLLLVGPGLIEAWPDLGALCSPQLARVGSGRGRAPHFLALPAARASTDAAINGGGPQGR